MMCVCVYMCVYVYVLYTICMGDGNLASIHNTYMPLLFAYIYKFYGVGQPTPTIDSTCAVGTVPAQS